MDDADRAQQFQEDLAADALARHRASMLSPIGKCHNCNEKLDFPFLFCDADCQTDYEKRMKRKRLQSGS